MNHDHTKTKKKVDGCDIFFQKKNQIQAAQKDAKRQSKKMAAVPVDYKFEASKIEINPNSCPIDAPVNLSVEFSLGSPIDHGQWSVKVKISSPCPVHISSKRPTHENKPNSIVEASHKQINKKRKVNST